MEKTLALCCDLIRKQSVTPEDGGCQQLIMERLAALGFNVTDLPFGEVSNFWAVYGTEGPILAFAGHTDVVPPGPDSDWNTPPFEPTLVDDTLYGRGTADMKGSLAAMLIACEEFLASNAEPKGRIAFLITSDEEGPAVDGTVKVLDYLKSRGEQIDWCVVGEPSSSASLGDTIKNGRRGSLGATLRIQGIQGHIAYPQLAENPIHTMLPALSDLCTEVWDEGNGFFPPTSFQISNIGAGTGATNVIPGEVQLQFNFRFSTEVTDAQLRRRTEAILDQHSLRYNIDWQLSGQPFLTEPGELVNATVESISAVSGSPPELSTAGGTSDGRFIAPTGAQVIELGPVNTTIHQVNEEVCASDLPRLAAMYRGILERLLG